MGNENEEPVTPAPSKASKKTSATQTRTITRGRIVDYHHPEGDEVNPLSALVTNVARVGDILSVNLCVFDAFGGTFGVQGIKQGDGPGEWSWPDISA